MIYFHQEEEEYCCGAARPQFLLTDYCKHTAIYSRSRVSVFKVHWGYSFPGHKNNLYLCEYRSHFFPLSLKRESKARCFLPVHTQALKAQLGWGWGQGWDVQAVALLVLPWAAVGCCLVPSHPSGIRHLQTLIACHCCRNHHFMGRWELTVFCHEHTLLFRF